MNKATIFGLHFGLHCEECGRYLVETVDGSLTCPDGHGTLIREEPELIEAPEPWWFPDYGGEG